MPPAFDGNAAITAYRVSVGNWQRQTVGLMLTLHGVSVSTSTATLLVSAINREGVGAAASLSFRPLIHCVSRVLDLSGGELVHESTRLTMPALSVLPNTVVQLCVGWHEASFGALALPRDLRDAELDVPLYSGVVRVMTNPRNQGCHSRLKKRSLRSLAFTQPPKQVVAHARR